MRETSRRDRYSNRSRALAWSSTWLRWTVAFPSARPATLPLPVPPQQHQHHSRPSLGCFPPSLLAADRACRCRLACAAINSPVTIPTSAQNLLIATAAAVTASDSNTRTFAQSMETFARHSAGYVLYLQAQLALIWAGAGVRVGGTSAHTRTRASARMRSR